MDTGSGALFGDAACTQPLVRLLTTRACVPEKPSPFYLEFIGSTSRVFMRPPGPQFPAVYAKDANGVCAPTTDAGFDHISVVAPVEVPSTEFPKVMSWKDIVD